MDPPDASSRETTTLDKHLQANLRISSGIKLGSYKVLVHDFYHV